MLYFPQNALLLLYQEKGWRLMSVCLTGVNIRVIDPFTIKPLDATTVVASARATQGRVITVEDHYKEGMQFSGPSVTVL